MEDQKISMLGTNIARYRKAEGLSAAELAEKAGEGLSRSVIANLESGRKDDVTVKQLVALANALRIPPATLVTDLFDPGAPAPYDMPSATREVFVVDALRVKQWQTLTRSSEFFQWFGGRTLISSEPLTGAQKVVSDVLNALNGYDLAWKEFHNALEAWFNIEDRDYETDDEDHERFKNMAEGRLGVAATNVLQWVNVLDSNGIKNENIRSVIETAMGRAQVMYLSTADG